MKDNVSAEKNTANREELYAMITAAQNGDKKAMETLTEQNMGLVRSVAQRFRDRGVEYEDLVQIGVMGMFRAIKSFDVSYQTAFSTYAVPLIVGEIRRYLRDDGMVKVSRQIKQQGVQIMRTQEEFRAKNGRDGTPAEIAARVGMSLEEYFFALEAITPVRSLSEPVRVGEEELLLESVLSDDTGHMEYLTDHITLQQAIKHLEPMEQKVLYLRYRKDLSQQQTAALLGLTQVKISRMEKKIFERLRKELS